MARSQQSLYMPSLQSTIEEFDRELALLHILRSIVAGLGRTPKVVARLISSRPGQQTPRNWGRSCSTGERASQAAKESQSRCGQAPRTANTEVGLVSGSTCLRGNGPKWPGRVQPDWLAEQKAQREQSRVGQQPIEPVQEGEDLEALTRNLAARWSIGVPTRPANNSVWTVIPMTHEKRTFSGVDGYDPSYGPEGQAEANQPAPDPALHSRVTGTLETRRYASVAFFFAIRRFVRFPTPRPWPSMRLEVNFGPLSNEHSPAARAL